MSPEADDPEPEYNLTPRTEAKFNKIEDDFQTMLQRNQMAQARANSIGGGGAGSGSASDYTIPVSVPVPTGGGGAYGPDSAIFKASPQVSHATISPRPSSSEPENGGPFCELIWALNLIPIQEVTDLFCLLLDDSLSAGPDFRRLPLVITAIGRRLTKPWAQSEQSRWAPLS